MNVLVVNCGSSSIKTRTIDVLRRRVLFQGLVERIGEAPSRLTLGWLARGAGWTEVTEERRVGGHREGFAWLLEAAGQAGAARRSGELAGVGHRVVHGGWAFQEPALVTEDVVCKIRETVPLAPLHNPANLTGIEVCLELLPHVDQVAVFDTAFHHTVPEYAFRYAIPVDLYETHHVRRYGFHGTSHAYVSKRAARHLGKPLEELNLITFHLGNGASAAAIRAGRSVDTSMGMTPLEGLVMGTRSGDLDPAVPFYLSRATGRSWEEIEHLLNDESGLRGLCGVNDMREVERLVDGGDEAARLAIAMYCYRIRKYLGAYLAVLGRVDAVVFTGGVGENAGFVREGVCEGLEPLGLRLDRGKNALGCDDVLEVQADGSPVKLLVVRTDEELEIACQTLDCIRARRGPDGS